MQIREHKINSLEYAEEFITAISGVLTSAQSYMKMKNVS